MFFCTNPTHTSTMPWVYQNKIQYFRSVWHKFVYATVWKKNYKILCIFAYATSRLYLYSLFFSSRESTGKVAKWIRRWPKSWEDPGSNPAWTLFFYPFCSSAFFCIFCANLTHVSTHAWHVQKFAISLILGNSTHWVLT